MIRWNGRPYLRFLLQETPDPNAPALLKAFVEYAREMIAATQTTPKVEKTFMLIRRAHQDDVEATFLMAKKYRTGEDGFPLSKSLYKYWMDKGISLLVPSEQDAPPASPQGAAVQ